MKIDECRKIDIGRLRKQRDGLKLREMDTKKDH